MPRISAEHRARMCSYTYVDGRRCRLLRAGTLPYCPTHFAKVRKKQETEYAALLLTEPLAHEAVASTSLTFILGRLFALVANGKVSAKTSNALLRIVDGMRKTLHDTQHEFNISFDYRGLSDVVKDLYDEHEEFLRSTDPLPSGTEDASAPTALQSAPRGNASHPGSSENPASPSALRARDPGNPISALSPNELLKRVEQHLKSL